MKFHLGRRQFIKTLGVTAGALGLTSIGTPASAGVKHKPPGQDITWEEMNLYHQQGVEDFLAYIGQDDLFWGNVMDYTMDGDVKVFEIACQQVEWTTVSGTSYPAYTYNGTVPGPQIRVTEGDNVRINVTNEMDEPTAIHWHGLYVPNSMDGVPYLNQPPINPGETFTYEFTARNPGSHMYHSHHNAAEQTVRGMLGAFIIDPADPATEPEADADYVFILNDSGLGFTINGREFPETQPIIANMGDRIRIRYMNEGLMIHPMHLHGMPMLVYAKDGWKLPVPYLCDTLNIAPGERYDVFVECTEPGAWAFHCHILTHAESRHGMFGMVTALVVNEPE